MTCSLCLRAIPDDAARVTVYAELRDASRFTGIVWHPECAPAHQGHIAGHIAVILRCAAGPHPPPPSPEPPGGGA
jgi:hypothetical protein